MTLAAMAMVATALVTAGTASPVAAASGPGDVSTWGQNNLGQLGDGTGTDSASPVAVSCCGANGGVIELAGGRHHSVALAEDGTVWAWGHGVYGAVGDGTFINRTAPVQVLSGVDVVEIAAGHYHSMARTSGGEVYVWGRNDTSQLGLPGGNTNTPTLLPGFTDVVTMAGGRNHSAIVRAGGTVWTFGTNAEAQLGNGTIGGVNATPTQVTGSTGIEPITSIKIGRDTTYAISDDGSLWVWGANLQGAVGDGTRTDRPTPFEVQLGGPVLDAAGGAYHSLALRDDGQVFGWGLNRTGEAGVGTTQARYLTPEPTSITDGVSVGAGRNHSLAIRSDGSLMAWGKNDFGQLGDGTTTTRISPVPVPGITDAVETEGGRSHSRVLEVVEAPPPDTTPPTASWDAPASGSTNPSPVELTGTATDNVGVADTEMIIRDIDTGLYWRPTTNTWGTFARFPVPVDNPGAATTTFTYTFDPPTGSGNYRARVWANDTSNNTTTGNISLPFRIS